MIKSEKMRDLVKKAKQHVQKYRHTKNITHLLQASEKIWVAYVLFIERKVGRELYNYPSVKSESKKLINKGIIKEELFEKAYWLHIFHYEGWADPSMVIDYIYYCSRSLR